MTEESVGLTIIDGGNANDPAGWTATAHPDCY